MSLGQGSMKAEFLVIERDGWGARKTAVKTRTSGKRSQPWKLKSQSCPGDLRFSSHHLFVPNGCQTLFRERFGILHDETVPPHGHGAEWPCLSLL